MRAIVGGCLLVAAADGTIEQSEIEKMQKLLSVNEALSGFKPSEIYRQNRHRLLDSPQTASDGSMRRQVRDTVVIPACNRPAIRKRRSARNSQNRIGHTE